MLQTMQQTATTPRVSGSASFAAMLAALTTPPARKPAWNDDDLADDVATLSYERALRAHSRFRAPEPDDSAFAQPMNTEVLRFCEAIPDEADLDLGAAAPQAVSVAVAEPEPEAGRGLLDIHDRNLKSASITIRLSKAECVQLRRRAAEAGLTVSAYLRSCTFEAESLRALVKDTLAQLRKEPSKASQPVSIVAQRDWRHGLTKFWPRAGAAQSIARA
jgi:hypothetical protein